MREPSRVRSLWIVMVLTCFSRVWSQPSQTHVRLEPRAVIEKRLKSVRTDNAAREQLIDTWLKESGCEKGNLSEQTARVGLPPNVICVLPGESDAVIVVGAHTDHVSRAGDGVVDNWTGASLLPSLLFSLAGEKRRHTFVFIGFTSEEKGMVGSEYYVEHMMPDQRTRVQAMVNLDSLGLTPTKVWTSHSDKVLLDALASVARAEKLPATSANVDDLGSTDSESFARERIPRITLHSVTQETIHILHSSDDRLTAIKMDDFWDSYRLIAQYLAYLDEVLPLHAAEQAPQSH